MKSIEQFQEDIEILEKFNHLIKHSKHLKTFININQLKLEMILNEVEKIRPSFEELFQTIVIIEAMRTKFKHVLLFVDKDNNIFNSYYTNDSMVIQNLNKGYLSHTLLNIDEKEFKKAMVGGKIYINVTMDNQLFIGHDVLVQYKGKKDYLYLENLKTDFDYKVFIAYLFGLRSEIDTTKLGAIGYYQNKIVSDGFNALSRKGMLKELRYLINITSLISEVPIYFKTINNQNEEEQKELISEMYQLREMITTHAEANLLLNPHLKHIDEIIIPFHPCVDCAAKIVETKKRLNAKINIYIHKEFFGNSPEQQLNWKDSIEKAKKLLIENHILFKSISLNFDSI